MVDWNEKIYYQDPNMIVEYHWLNGGFAKQIFSKLSWNKDSKPLTSFNSSDQRSLKTLTGSAITNTPVSMATAATHCPPVVVG
mgnify:CR=1 FL=1